MLVAEVVHLRSVVNDRQSEVAPLNYSVEQLRNKFTELEKQLRHEFAGKGKALRDELTELKNQYQATRRAVDTQKSRLHTLRELLALCNDASGEPEASKIVRRGLAGRVPERPTGPVGEAWIQITESKLHKLEKGVLHTLHETIYGVYRERKSDGICFAFQLHDRRNFILRSFLTRQ